jgi:hypothetical protein
MFILVLCLLVSFVHAQPIILFSDNIDYSSARGNLATTNQYCSSLLLANQLNCSRAFSLLNYPGSYADIFPSLYSFNQSLNVVGIYGHVLSTSWDEFITSNWSRTLQEAFVVTKNPWFGKETVDNCDNWNSVGVSKCKNAFSLLINQKSLQIKKVSCTNARPVICVCKNGIPLIQPTTQPTTLRPTTVQPTLFPTTLPSTSPTKFPTNVPTVPTSGPTGPIMYVYRAGSPTTRYAANSFGPTMKIASNNYCSSQASVYCPYFPIFSLFLGGYGRSAVQTLQDANLEVFNSVVLSGGNGAQWGSSINAIYNSGTSTRLENLGLNIIQGNPNLGYVWLGSEFINRSCVNWTFTGNELTSQSNDFRARRSFSMIYGSTNRLTLNNDYLPDITQVDDGGSCEDNFAAFCVCQNNITIPSSSPTRIPTTIQPTQLPTIQPTLFPTTLPTKLPTSKSPSLSPTTAPSEFDDSFTSFRAISGSTFTTTETVVPLALVNSNGNLSPNISNVGNITMRKSGVYLVHFVANLNNTIQVNSYVTVRLYRNNVLQATVSRSIYAMAALDLPIIQTSVSVGTRFHFTIQTSSSTSTIVDIVHGIAKIIDRPILTTFQLDNAQTIPSSNTGSNLFTQLQTFGSSAPSITNNGDLTANQPGFYEVQCFLTISRSGTNGCDMRFQFDGTFYPYIETQFFLDSESTTGTYMNTMQFKFTRLWNLGETKKLYFHSQSSPLPTITDSNCYMRMINNTDYVVANLANNQFGTATFNVPYSQYVAMPSNGNSPILSYSNNVGTITMPSNIEPGYYSLYLTGSSYFRRQTVPFVPSVHSLKRGSATVCQLSMQRFNAFMPFNLHCIFNTTANDVLTMNRDETAAQNTFINPLSPYPNFELTRISTIIVPTSSPTLLPTTLQPTTLQPTQLPTTLAPTTLQPTTLTPTTLQPTLQPTTLTPTTLQPTTLRPTTLQPTTLQPTTLNPTLQPTTSSPVFTNLPYYVYTVDYIPGAGIAGLDNACQTANSYSLKQSRAFLSWHNATSFVNMKDIIPAGRKIYSVTNNLVTNNSALLFQFGAVGGNINSGADFDFVSSGVCAPYRYIYTGSVATGIGQYTRYNDYFESCYDGSGSYKSTSTFDNAIGGICAGNGAVLTNALVADCNLLSDDVIDTCVGWANYYGTGLECNVATVNSAVLCAVEANAPI